MSKLAQNATIRSFLFGLYKLKFILGARLAPQHTAASGAALFCTPIRPAAEKLLPPPGVPAARLRQAHLPSGTVTLYEWGDPAHQPTVLLSHGWNGWGLQFAGFIAPLLAQGLAVVALDFAGHGRSAGRRASLPGFIDTTEELIDSLPNLIGIVGHSLGAAAAACSLTHARHSALKLVLIAPPNNARLFLEKFAALLGIPQRLVNAMQRWMEQRYGRNLDDLSIERIASRIPAHTLVLHDPADKIVPFAHGESYAQLLSHAHLVPLAGCGHFRILQAPDAIRLSVEFVAAREVTLKSWRIPEKISPAW
jgi:pimeloyl-ACP methyl ester carboxylesterase